MEEFKEIRIDKIKHLENIRTRIKEKDIHELMDSIKQQGLLQPIGIWRTKKGEYIIAYGNRRLEACRKLGWKTITAKIKGELSVEDMLILNATENIHRKEVNLGELGRICNLLLETGLSRQEIAIRLSLAPSRVNMAVDTFGKIPKQHRNDIAFVGAGTKPSLRQGKIPAHLFSTILTMTRIYNLNLQGREKLINAVKKVNMNHSELLTLSAFLKEGMDLKEALINLERYAVRRLNLVADKKVEAEMMKKHKCKGIFEFYGKISAGKIKGNPKLVYLTETSV